MFGCMDECVIYVCVCLHTCFCPGLSQCMCCALVSDSCWFMTTFLHVSIPPLPSTPAHINTVSISQPQPLPTLGGLRRTTGGCKTCLWGLLTVHSLRQLARMDWPSLTRLCWVWLAHLLMDSLCLCLWLFPFSVFVSRQFRTSFPNCLAFGQLPLALFPLVRMFIHSYI